MGMTRFSARWRLAPEGSFRRGAIALATGTIAAQLVPFAVSPLLARLYTPPEYGVYAVFFSLALLLSLVVSGRYELGVVLPADDDEARSLLVLSLIVLAIGTCLVGLAAACVLVVAARLGVALWPTPFAFALPPTVAFMGLFQSFAYWATRRRRYRLLAVARITSALAVASTTVLLGFLGWGVYGLAMGFAVGQLAMALVLIVPLGPEAVRGARTDREHLTTLAKRYSDFPRVNTLHALLDGVRDAGLTALVALFFGTAANGLFAFTTRFLKAPVTLVASSISPVFYRSAGEAGAGRELSRLTSRTMLTTAFLAIPAFALVGIAGPWVFATLFGEAWREAGQYARILAPWLAASTIVAPVSQLPAVVGRMRPALAVGIVDLILKLLALAAGWTLGSTHTALVLMSASGTAVSLYLVTWYARIAREPAASEASSSDPAGTSQMAEALP